MTSIYFAAFVMLMSGFVVARGLRGWAARERPALWVPWVIQGVAGMVFVGAMLQDAPLLVFVATIGMLGPTIWRMRHPTG